MKQYFSSKLYKEALVQLRLLGILGAIVLFIAVILEPISLGLYWKEAFTEEFNTVLWMAPYGQVTIYVLLASFAFSVSLFGFLNKRRTSDFYHALPIGRSAIFGSFVAAILTWLWGTLFVVVLVTGACYALLGLPLGITVSVFSMLFGCAIAASLYAVAVTILALCITGTLFSNAIVLGLIVAYPIIISTVFAEGVSANVPTLYSDDVSLFNVHFRNVLFGFEDLVTLRGGAITPEVLWSMIFTFASGLLIFVLAAIAFIRRKSEAAGSSAPNKILHNVYRVAVAFLPLLGMSTVPILLTLGFSGLNIVLALVFSLIFLIAYELVSTKKIRYLYKALPALGIAIVLTLVFSAAVWAMSLYEASFAPSKDEISYVILLDRVFIDGSWDKATSNRIDKAFEKISRDRIENTDARLRATLADELAKAKAETDPRFAVGFLYDGYDPEDDETYDEEIDDWTWSWPISAYLEIHTTSGRVAIRSIPIGKQTGTRMRLAQQNPDGEWYEYYYEVTLNSLGSALVALAQDTAK